MTKYRVGDFVHVLYSMDYEFRGRVLSVNRRDYYMYTVSSPNGPLRCSPNEVTKLLKRDIQRVDAGPRTF